MSTIVNPLFGALKAGSVIGINRAYIENMAKAYSIPDPVFYGGKINSRALAILLVACTDLNKALLSPERSQQFTQLLVEANEKYLKISQPTSTQKILINRLGESVIF